MDAVLQRFFSMTEGKPVFIVPLPTRSFIRGEQSPVYLKRFMSLADHRRARYVIDVLPRFHALSAADAVRCTFEHDSHYSILGHRIVSDALSDALERFLPELVV